VQVFGRRHLCLAGHVHIRSPLDNSGSIESPSTVIIILSSLGGRSETRGCTIALGEQPSHGGTGADGPAAAG
jgi:hypothetical protein